jgi:hypothetical protein
MLEETQISGLRAAMRGQVISHEDPGYSEARRVLNAMIDRHPAAIARCTGAADVIDFAGVPASRTGASLRGSPAPRVLHPYPVARFPATHPRWESYA